MNTAEPNTPVTGMVVLWPHNWLTFAVEAALTCAALAWLAVLAEHVWRTYSTTDVFDGRVMSELVLLALLVAWTLLRARIRRAVWMRTWGGDAPIVEKRLAAHLAEGYLAYSVELLQDASRRGQRTR